MRVFNFSAGPAALPEPVLRQAAEEMLDWHGSGMSVMEMSHRGPEFISIYEEAVGLLRELLAELGLTGFETYNWFGILMPAGTSPLIIARFSSSCWPSTTVATSRR